MLTDDNFEDLKVRGYTVVKDVLTRAECDDLIGQYRQWLSHFKDGDWPITRFSLIQRYNTGHMEPTWRVRLKAKKIFAQLWGTDKLLTSIDAIAIGRPPEEGEEQFHTPDSYWLHLDQYPPRLGLHAYQGSVYLEDTAEDDWTLEVMEGSQLHHEEYFKAGHEHTSGDQKFSHADLLRYLQWGCLRRRVPVPKGGIVLWDSRVVHANARPFKNRKYPGRWRWCVFVSMTPAIWATEDDIKTKKTVYEHAYMTSHWSSQGISFFESGSPEGCEEVPYQRDLPEIAKTDECKRMCGFLAYDFEDGKPTGKELRPRWKHQRECGTARRNWTFIGGILSASVAAVCILYAVYTTRVRH